MPPELTDRPRASAAAPAGVAAIPNGGVLRSFPNARVERETETEGPPDRLGQMLAWPRLLRWNSHCTARQRILQRCPNLVLASTFFALRTKGPLVGTKGPCPTVVRGVGIFSPGWYYQPGLKVYL